MWSFQGLKKELKENNHAAIDLGVILMIGVAFVGMMVVAYILYYLMGTLWHTPTATDTIAYNSSYNQSQNITKGFDNAISLILVAITVWVLAIAISALLILRGRNTE